MPRNSSNHSTHPAALAHLRAADPRMRAIIDHVGPFDPDMTADPFYALAASIVHQQLSMKAAATINGRLIDLCPRRRLTPAALLAIPDDALRNAGLSRQKLAYLRDLAAHFADGRLKTATLRKLPDDQVIAAVTTVKGIGQWTAEMLLLFCLDRPDVWPIDDLGLQKALQRLLEKRKPLSRAQLAAAGEPYRPFRSYATWYLWRSLDGPVKPGLNH